MFSDLSENVSSLNDEDLINIIVIEDMSNDNLNPEYNELSFTNDEQDFKSEIDADDGDPLERIKIEIEENSDTDCAIEKVNTISPLAQKCILTDCDNFLKLTDGITFFNIPNDENERKLWEFCLAPKDVSSLEDNDTICQSHFYEGDIIQESDGAKLKRGALPCIDVIKGCCVPECVNNDKDTELMFHFPIFGDFSSWLNRIVNPSLMGKSKYELLKYRICERHFDKKLLNSLNLSYSVKPHLNLPSKGFYKTVVDSYLNRKEKILEGFGSKLLVNNKNKPETVNNFDTSVCAFKGCSKKPSLTERFFKIPTDFKRGKVWLRACGRSDVLAAFDYDIVGFLKNSVGICMPHVGKKYVPDIKETYKSPAVAKKVILNNGTVIMPNTKVKIIDNQSDKILDKTDGQSTKLCAHANCTDKFDRITVLYKFPSDNIMRQKWLESCGVQVSVSETEESIRNFCKKFAVCSDHFTSSQFDEMHNLLPSAIPNPFEGNVKVSEAPSKNQPEMDMETDKSITPVSVVNNAEIKSVKGRMFFGCSSSTCSSMSKPPFQKFPDPNTDLDRFKVWVRLLANPQLNHLPPSIVYNLYGVCSKHFDDSFKDKENCLSSDAVPTKCLAGDIEWLYTSEYFKTRIANSDAVDVNILEDDISPNDLITWKVTKSNKQDIDKNYKSKCILMEDRLEFPTMGKTLFFDKKQLPKKRKFAYDIYRYNKHQKSLGLTEDVNLNEKLVIHTAVIIDDDEESEKEAIFKIHSILKQNP